MKTNPMWMLPVLLMVAGCADANTDDKTVVEPVLGAADSLRSVQQIATLGLGEGIDGEFDEDAQFHGYRFSSLPTGQITAEVTQRGSSRGLDTTMFLFGQKSSGDWQRIAFDDDDGWGKLSGIYKIRVNDFGEYMVVLGTANGMGRGKYHLDLSCTNGACIDTSIPNITGCDRGVYDVLSECVQGQLDNADWGEDDPAEEWSIDWCVGDGYQDTLDWNCDGGAFQPDFCRASTAQLDAAGGACEAELKDEYNVIDTLPLGRLDLSPALQDHAYAIEDSIADGLVELTGFTAPIGADPQEVAASLRLDHGHTRDLEIHATMTRADFRAETLNGETFDLIEAEHGVDYQAVTIYGSYPVAAGAEEYVAIELAFYPALGIGYSIKGVSGD